MIGESSTTSGGATGLPNEESIFEGGSSHVSDKDLQFIQAGYRFNGKNYLKWSQVVQTFLKGKGKLWHLTGASLLKEDPRFDAWDEEDSMIMTWLWNSITPESKVKDAAQVYEIRTKAISTKQGGGSVTDYANILQSLWQELDHYRCIQITNPADAIVVRKMLEQDRVYDFLASLNMKYDQVRIQTLGREEVLPLNTVIAIVHAEERSAFASTGGRVVHQIKAATGDENRSSSNNNSNLWCTYCKKPRHAKDRCWKLYGKPSTSSKEWGQKGQQQKANLIGDVGTNEDDKTDSATLEKIKSLIETLEKSSRNPESGICSLFQSGKASESSCVYTPQ
ncbi:hypothetical protein ACOSQ4_022780 [Xanthoceras sorbifolium]